MRAVLGRKAAERARVIDVGVDLVADWLCHRRIRLGWVRSAHYQTVN
jgi:hypothetical protein